MRLDTHFEKEEEIFLPLLERLPEEDASAVFVDMHESIHRDPTAALFTHE